MIIGIRSRLLHSSLFDLSLVTLNKIKTVSYFNRGGLDSWIQSLSLMDSQILS